MKKPSLLALHKRKPKGATTFSINVGYFTTLQVEDLEFLPDRGEVTFVVSTLSKPDQRVTLRLCDVASVARTGIAGNFQISYYRVEASAVIYGVEEPSNVPGLTKIRRSADNKVFYYNEKMVVRQPH